MKIVGVDFGTKGARKFTARVASAEQGGNIELRLGGLDGMHIGTCKVEDTGGMQQRQDAICEVSRTTGVQVFIVNSPAAKAPCSTLTIGSSSKP